MTIYYHRATILSESEPYFSNKRRTALKAKNEVCAARGCGRPTAKARGDYQRTMDGAPVCRACYQRAWEYARNKGVALSEVRLKDLPPPLFDPPAPATTCARSACGIAFEAGERDSNRRRFIGGLTVCRPCYMLAWKKAKEWNVPLDSAFRCLPAKKGGRHG